MLGTSVPDCSRDTVFQEMCAKARWKVQGWLPLRVRFKGPTPEKPKTSEDLYMDVRSNTNTSISFGVCAIVVNDLVHEVKVPRTPSP